MTYSKLGIDVQTGELISISQSSRRQGLYIIGANGTGKTGLIENLIVQDIEQGIGVAVLDPHGDLTNNVIARTPDNRLSDIILLDIADEATPFGFNLFTCDNPNSKTAVQEVVDQVMHIFEKLFETSRGGTPLLLDYLRNCTYVLIANSGFTMADIPVLFTNKQCRQKLLSNVKDPDVRDFWAQYEEMKPNEQREEAASTLRRVREFLQPLTRNIVGQAQTTVDLRQVMDERKILLVQLSARLDSATSLIGSMLIALLLNAAYSRSELEVKKRKQFNIYADEFQRFATDDFATLLTEARKFGIATTIAHQTRQQISERNRANSLQAANLVVFHISGPDSQELASNFDRTPPPAETRQEPIRSLSQLPFDDLIRSSHENAEVQRLTRNVLLPIAEKLVVAQDLYNPSSEAWDTSRGACIALKNSVNRFLVDVMAEEEVLFSPAFLDRSSKIMHTFARARIHQYAPFTMADLRDVFNELNDLLSSAQNKGTVDEAKKRELLQQWYRFGGWRLRTARLHHPEVEQELADVKRTYAQVQQHTEQLRAQYKAEEQKELERVKGVWSQDIRAVWEKYRQLEEKLGAFFKKPEVASILDRGDETLKSVDKVSFTREYPEYISAFNDPPVSREEKIAECIASSTVMLLFPKREIQRQRAWWREYIRLDDLRKKYYEESRKLNEAKEKEERRLYEDRDNAENNIWRAWKEIIERDCTRPVAELTARIKDLESRLYETVTHPEIQAQLEKQLDRLLADFITAPSTANAEAKRMQNTAALGTEPFDWYLGLLRLCQLLSIEENKVKVVSGSKQVPGSPRTYQDMQNEIASRLTNLSKYMAKVRIALEEKTVEYTIRTLEPERGVRRKELDERKRTIKTNNLHAGYLRWQDEVEEEISSRQANCRGTILPQERFRIERGEHDV